MPKSFSEDGAFGASGTVAGETPATSTPAGAVAGVYKGLSMSPSRPGNMLAGDQINGGSYDNWYNSLSPNQLQMLASNPNGRSAFFADGGAVGDDSGIEDSDDSSTAQPMGGFDPSAALDIVDQALGYGRQLHGLGGAGNDEAIPEQDTAGLTRMPAVPGNPSDSGIPKPQPFGTLPPTSNPFGKRVSANYPMPTMPASQSSTGVRTVPGPGTLPPTANPFGKRADAGGDQGDDNDGDESASAIPEDDDNVAA